MTDLSPGSTPTRPEPLCPATTTPACSPAGSTELERRLGCLTDLHVTPAEIRILPFLPTHLSIKEIAAQLYVSPATVKTHVSAVYEKLDASTRSEAVARMQHLGLHLAGLRLEDDQRGGRSPALATGRQRS